jgi:hypothetical protein
MILSTSHIVFATLKSKLSAKGEEIFGELDSNNVNIDQPAKRDAVALS